MKIIVPFIFEANIVKPRCRKVVSVIVRDQVIEFAHHIAAGLRIYNGKMYQRSGKPFYEVATFGLSNKPGGTALFIETTKNTSRCERYQFSALGYDTALAYATQTTESRGDTMSLPIEVN